MTDIVEVVVEPETSIVEIHHKEIRYTAPPPPPPLVWPPVNALRIHPDMPFGGTDSAVTTVQFPNGITLSAVPYGDNSPITHDANGFHFTGGQYLSAVLSSTPTFSAGGIFARVTSTSTVGWQYPLSMVGDGESILGFYRSGNRMISDLGTARLYRQNIGGLFTGGTSVIGVYFEAGLAKPEPGGAHAIWVDGRIVDANVSGEKITPTEWQIGKGFQGTIHEGIVFLRPESVDAPLYPEGGSSQWVIDNLMQAS